MILAMLIETAKLNDIDPVSSARERRATPVIATKVSEPDRSARTEFQDPDVAAAYVLRPDYPPGLYQTLLDKMPARRRVLDLGSGPGKIARALAHHVGEVLAVDPSAAMLSLGKSLDGGAHPNIRWIEGFAEDLAVEDASLDLAVAGAAIQWMDPSQLFPKLARALAPGALVAIVDGDAPAAAPWLEAYEDVIKRWVERLGGVWNGESHCRLMAAHLAWLDVQGEMTFTVSIRQPLEDLIACQHSRATWSRTRMGSLTEVFDVDLRNALEPGVQDGMITFEMATKLAWGRPREA